MTISEAFDRDLCEDGISQPAVKHVLTIGTCCRKSPDSCNCPISHWQTLPGTPVVAKNSTAKAGRGWDSEVQWNGNAAKLPPGKWVRNQYHPHNPAHVIFVEFDLVLVTSRLRVCTAERTPTFRKQCATGFRLSADLNSSSCFRNFRNGTFVCRRKRCVPVQEQPALLRLPLS